MAVGGGGGLCLHLSLIWNLKLTLWTCIGGHGMGEGGKGEGEDGGYGRSLFTHVADLEYI